MLEVVYYALMRMQSQRRALSLTQLREVTVNAGSHDPAFMKVEELTQLARVTPAPLTRYPCLLAAITLDLSRSSFSQTTL